MKFKDFIKTKYNINYIMTLPELCILRKALYEIASTYMERVDDLIYFKIELGRYIDAFIEAYIDDHMND